MFIVQDFSINDKNAIDFSIIVVHITIIMKFLLRRSPTGPAAG
jgi:hypothetical protein